MHFVYSFPLLKQLGKYSTLKKAQICPAFRQQINKNNCQNPGLWPNKTILENKERAVISYKFRHIIGQNTNKK